MVTKVCPSRLFSKGRWGWLGALAALGQAYRNLNKKKRKRPAKVMRMLWPDKLNMFASIRNKDSKNWKSKQTSWSWGEKSWR